MGFVACSGGCGSRSVVRSVLATSSGPKRLRRTNVSVDAGSVEDSYSLSLKTAVLPKPATRSYEVSSRRSTDSSLLAYLKEIGSVNLLEGDEVVECSKSVQKLLKWELSKAEIEGQIGREATMQEWADILDMPQPLFLEELHRLRTAKERLIAGNLRLVVSIAKRYVANSKLNMLDLIQEGSLGKVTYSGKYTCTNLRFLITLTPSHPTGLIRGAERFDASKGFRFATYASWWIRQAVQRAANESSRQIRLPPNLNSTAKKVYRLRKEMFLKNLREPTFEELAEEMDISVRRLRFVLEKEKETDTLSLDKPIRNHIGEDMCLSDIIVDDRLSPEQVRIL